MIQVRGSSTFNTKAFLTKAWAARGELSSIERQGFSYFFYIYLANHIEAIMVDILVRRLTSVKTVADAADTNWAVTVGGAEPTIHSMKPAFASGSALAEEYLKRVNESAPFGQLKDIFSKIFHVGMEKHLGVDLYADVDALIKLRNILAHGRTISFSLDESGENSLEKNPLQPFVKRLYAKNIVNKMTVNGADHVDLMAHLVSDPAMIAFLKSVGDTEKKLKEILLAPEQVGFGFISLPDLSI